MSTSNTGQPGDREPFDAEKFARDTVFAIETGDDYADVLEEHVLAIEEAIAAPWYRRWLLWRRLRRELRASVAGYPDEFAPRGDFRARRVQYTSETATAIRAQRARGRHSQPGEGLMP